MSELPGGRVETVSYSDSEQINGRIGRQLSLIDLPMPVGGSRHAGPEFTRQYVIGAATSAGAPLMIRPVGSPGRSEAV